MAGPRQTLSICAVRISRLLSNGAPDGGNAKGAWVGCGVGHLTYTFEVDTGDDIFEKDGYNRACLVRKYPDQLKRITAELEFCTHDYRISEILGTAQAVVDPAGTEVVGMVTPVGAGCTVATPPPKVCIEAWSEQWACSVPHDDPFVRTILPMTTWLPTGQQLQRGGTRYLFRGIGSPNNNYGDGPFHDTPELLPFTNWAHAELDDQVLPVCSTDYVPLP